MKTKMDLRTKIFGASKIFEASLQHCSADNPSAAAQTAGINKQQGQMQKSTDRPPQSEQVLDLDSDDLSDEEEGGESTNEEEESIQEMEGNQDIQDQSEPEVQSDSEVQSEIEEPEVQTEERNSESELDETIDVRRT